ncbi:uncharacterized protein LOC125473502 isoform X1 [Pyrus x bretschneideri]|uniref:uncharacterized protein LOC125473502 isoform X1 n=1 Tax=Pyrus x bretschneideri TaxID=225117 RepID=UPI00202FC640|nr:uncharacterized protein LOC125473502 isoform X1 [Pyrus x bretschneideri]
MDLAYFLITLDPTSIYIHFVDCCPQEKLTDYFISLETFALTWKFSIRPTNQCRQRSLFSFLVNKFQFATLHFLELQSANENPRVTNLPQLKSSKSRRVDQRGGGKYFTKGSWFSFNDQGI